MSGRACECDGKTQSKGGEGENAELIADAWICPYVLLLVQSRGDAPIYIYLLQGELSSSYAVLGEGSGHSASS
jgi:hypothetical protein